MVSRRTCSIVLPETEQGCPASGSSHPHVADECDFYLFSRQDPPLISDLCFEDEEGVALQWYWSASLAPSNASHLIPVTWFSYLV